MAARKTISNSKPDKLMRDALMVALKRTENGDVRPKIRRIAEKWVELAISGDMQAIKEIRDTVDGRPAQAIVGDPEKPLQVVAVSLRPQMTPKEWIETFVNAKDGK